MAMNYSEKLREPQSPGKRMVRGNNKRGCARHSLFLGSVRRCDVWVGVTDMVFRYRRILSEERWPLASVAVTM